METDKKPYIIEIEGTDGSGKQRQTELLYNFLCSAGYKCLKLSFPNYNNPSSALVKMYLNGDLGDSAQVNPYQASIVYAADRMITFKQTNIADYDFVVLDRYVGSNMIHQSARITDAKELDKFLHWIDELEFELLKLPRPDLVLFLNVPAEISFKLANSREKLKNNSSKDILEQDKNHFFLAHAKAEEVAKRFNWTTINCTSNGELLPIDAIAEKIKEIVSKKINKN